MSSNQPITKDALELNIEGYCESQQEWDYDFDFTTVTGVPAKDGGVLEWETGDVSYVDLWNEFCGKASTRQSISDVMTHHVDTFIQNAAEELLLDEVRDRFDCFCAERENEEKQKKAPPLEPAAAAAEEEKKRKIKESEELIAKLQAQLAEMKKK